MGSLREIRKQKGLKLKEVAERLCVSVNTVWRWEKGDMEPSLDNLRRISSLYGVPIDEILQNPTQSPQPESLPSCGD